MVWLKGSCRQNGYGNKKKCNGSKNCSTITEKRDYKNINGIEPKSLTVFNGKKYCGKSLLNRQTYKDLKEAKGGSCPSGHTLCSFDGYMCVKGRVCPINTL